MEGSLYKVGRTSDSMTKKFFMLRDSALIMFSSVSSQTP